MWWELGTGFLESVYEAALTTVLVESGLHVDRQHAIDVQFHGKVIRTFRADLLVERQILVELKVVKTLLPIHQAQVLNYLRCSALRVGLLVNLGTKVEIRRLVL